MRQIYISHGRTDEAAAAALSNALEAAGHTVWRHTRTHLGDWGLATPKAHLAAADDVIAIWSKHSIENPDVLETAERAQAEGRLTSALAEYVKPPVVAESRRVIDITELVHAPSEPATRRLRDHFPSVGSAVEPAPVAAPERAVTAPVKPKARAKRPGIPRWPLYLTAATCVAAVGAAFT